MISQLEGLVKALKGRSSQRVTCVTVLDPAYLFAGKIAERLAAHSKRVLLLSMQDDGVGVADWSEYLQGRRELVMPNEWKETGLCRLEANGDFGFPSWASGETARRLLDGAQSIDADWDYAVFALGLEHNEGTLSLFAESDSVLFTIPEGNLKKANALCLLQAALARSTNTGVWLVPSRLATEDAGFLDSKLFAQVSAKSLQNRVRLLASSGDEAVEEFVKLVRKQPDRDRI